MTARQIVKLALAITLAFTITIAMMMIAMMVAPLAQTAFAARSLPLAAMTAFCLVRLELHVTLWRFHEQ